VGPSLKNHVVESVGKIFVDNSKANCIGRVYASGDACPTVRQFFVMNNLLTNGSRKPIEPRE